VTAPLRLTLGPVQYHWPRTTLETFYEEVATGPAEVVYLGETVCSKRRELRLDDWLEIAGRLQEAGKEVVLSSLALIEAESELKTLRRLCANGRFTVEANDVGAVRLLAEQGIGFVTGPAVNIYNQHTLALLARQGLKRWVMPFELARDTLAGILAEAPEGIETEVTVYGRIPLAWSARCFTARHHNLPKDDCQEVCDRYPDGLLVHTRETTPFLAFNGIQTQSAQTYALAAELADMAGLGVGLARVYPQAEGTGEVLATLAAVRDGELDGSEAQDRLEALMPVGSCRGYWYGEAGIAAAPEAVS
jgi:collagenase-like PrtC family protease